MCDLGQGRSFLVELRRELWTTQTRAKAGLSVFRGLDILVSLSDGKVYWIRGVPQPIMCRFITRVILSSRGGLPLETPLPYQDIVNDTNIVRCVQFYRVLIFM